MINKTIHGLIFGFYIIFALLCGMGGFVLANMSFVMTCLIIIIIVLICLATHGFFLGKQIFSFGRNVILDIEDGHNHLQSELGNIRSVMDSFTNILDTVIEQQTSLDKKVDILIKKPVPSSELHFEADNTSEKTISPQDHYYDIHKIQPKHFLSSSVEMESFDDKTLPDFLSEPEEDKVLSGFSEEFMTYPMKSHPHPQHKNEFAPKTMMSPMSQNFETHKELLAEEEFADVTDFVNNAAQNNAELLKHDIADMRIENEEFSEDITKMMRHNIGEKAIHHASPVAVDIKEQQKENKIEKQAAMTPIESVSQKSVPKKSITPPSPHLFKNDMIDKKVEVPSLKELIPQETALMSHTRLTKSFVQEGVPSLDSLIKQEKISSTSDVNLPDTKISSPPQMSSPEVVASQPLEKISPASVQPSVQPAPAQPPTPMPQFKTKALQPTSSPTMKPSPDEDVKTLPAENLSQIIRQALERNAIDTFIRPVIDSVSRETCYFEAYSYLRDVQEKHHPPKYFLPQAERDGLHTTIDRILLTRSIQIVRALQNAGKKVGVFSNISVKSVTDGDFMEELLEMVREKHDLSQGVVLEFSQRQLNYMTSIRIEKMTRLSSHGFMFSLDNVERPLPDLRELTAVGFRFLKLTPQDLDKGMSIAGKLVKGNEIKRLCNELNMKLVIIHVQDHNDMLTVMNYGADFLQGDLLGGVKRLDQLDLQAP